MSIIYNNAYYNPTELKINSSNTGVFYKPDKF